MFLAMAPVVVVMAWTFLQFGSTARVEGLREERRIRCLHTAEAALRSFLATGQEVRLELNGCRGYARMDNGKVSASAVALENERDGWVRIELELDRGFVMRRTAREDREVQTRD